MSYFSSIPGDGGRVRTVARAAVAVGATVFLLTQVSIGRVFDTLTGADVGLVVLALLASAGCRIGASLRLREFVASTGYRAPLWSVVRVDLASRFYPLFVPGGNITGGAVRILRLRDLEVPATIASASVVRDRVDATLFLTLVGGFFFTLEAGAGPDLPLYAFLAVIGVVLLAAPFVLESPAARWLDDRVEATGEVFRESSWVATVGEKLRDFWSAVRLTGSMDLPKHLALAALSIGIHLIGTAAYAFLAMSVGIELSFAQMGWIRAAVMMVTMIPVSLGGVGVREAGFVLLLAPLGVPRGDALALSVLVFAVTVLSFGLLGAVSEGTLSRWQVQASSGKEGTEGQEERGTHLSPLARDAHTES